MQYQQTLRSKLVTRRTYSRPLDEQGKVFESWEQTVDRVIEHQRWLWERAANNVMTEAAQYPNTELEELRQLMLDRKVLMSGRTLWLGGTEVAKRREASQFNCSFTNVETVYDVVDVLWLLMQGCGVGFRPVVGQLTGFQKPITNVQVIPSTKAEIKRMLKLSKTGFGRLKWATVLRLGVRASVSLWLTNIKLTPWFLISRRFVQKVRG